MPRNARRAAESPGPSVLYLPQGPTPGSKFLPRSYQLPVIQAWESGIRRLVIVWPRRHGKDLVSLAITQKSMLRRPGLYWHIYPTKVRGREALWDGSDFDNVPFRNRWPSALIADSPNGPGGKAINDTEMRIDFKPFPGQPAGSSWQIMGGDNPDNLAGPNPVGVVFSEYQLHDPKCWTKIVEPILAENGGWAIFDFTPEGKNHAYELFRMAERDPKWFAQRLTVAEARRDAPGEKWFGSPVILEQDDPAFPMRDSIDQMRRSGTPEEEIQSQYYCSFEGSIRGAIFGDLVARAEQEKRVEFLPYRPELPVGTAWDIGRDTTAIWCFQEVGQALHFIDYFEEAGQGLDYWSHFLKERTLYRFGLHLFPHDMAVTEWTATESRLARAETLGLTPAEVAPKVSHDDAIDATRVMFRRLRFDGAKCARGLDALRSYQYAWDEKRQSFSREPVHNWASHGSSALRTLAVAYRAGMLDEFDEEPLQRYARAQTDPLASFRSQRMVRGSV